MVGLGEMSASKLLSVREHGNVIKIIKMVITIIEIESLVVQCRIKLVMDLWMT